MEEWLHSRAKEVRILTLLVVFPLAVASCDVAGGPETEPAPSGPTSATIRDASVSEARRFLLTPSKGLRGSIDAGPEGFYPDGIYIASGLAGIQGRYSLSGNVVCVSQTLRAPVDYCRPILIGPEGAFFGPPIETEPR